MFHVKWGYLKEEMGKGKEKRKEGRKEGREGGRKKGKKEGRLNQVMLN